VRSLGRAVYSGGKIVKLAGTFQNIDKYKRAEVALQVSLEKYRVLFESFPLGITISDKSGKIIEGNRQSEKLLGINREAHAQRRIDSKEWQIIRKDGTPMPADEYASTRALRENRLIENVEMGIVKDKGEITWISVTAAPIPLEGYSVVIAYGDITERKQAEEALRLRTHQLEAVCAVSTEITRELDLQNLLSLITRHAAELLGATGGTVRFWDEEVQMLIPAAWYGLADAVREERRRLGEGISGTAAQRREGLIINEYPRSPYATPPVLERARVIAVLAEPLLYRDRLLGVLNVEKHEPGGSFTEADQGVLRLFATQAAIAIENARLFERVRHGRERLRSLSRRLVEV
jgi:PAS domain S-box-containing protein